MRAFTSAPAMIHVVAGLIYREGKLLVCRRRKDAAHPLKWEFPGGKIEAGESDQEALRRELVEELGIEIRRSGLVYRQEHAYPDAPAVSLRFYRVHEFHGQVENRVFDRIAWVKLADLERLDFLAGDIPIVRRLSAEGEKFLDSSQAP